MRRMMMCLPLALLSGCFSLVTRCPCNEFKVKQIYQSTTMAAQTSYVIAFPQVMSSSPMDCTWWPMNFLTIPLGVVSLCDACAEACIDTVFLPCDLILITKGRR